MCEHFKDNNLFEKGDSHRMLSARIVAFARKWLVTLEYFVC